MSKLNCFEWNSNKEIKSYFVDNGKDWRWRRNWFYLFLRSGEFEQMNVLFGCRRSVIVISCGGWPVGVCWNTRAPFPPGTPTSGPPTPRGRAWCWTSMTLPLALGELSPSPSGKGMREGRLHRRGSSQRFLCCLIYYILIIFSCNEKKHNYL